MTLAELLLTEPYASELDPEACAALVNAATVPGFQDVEWDDLVLWPHGTGLRRSDITTRAGNADANIAAGAQHILDCINAGHDLRTSSAAVRSLLNDALPAGTARDALLALASRDIPIAETLDPPFGFVWPADIEDARNA